MSCHLRTSPHPLSRHTVASNTCFSANSSLSRVGTITGTAVAFVRLVTSVDEPPPEGPGDCRCPHGRNNRRGQVESSNEESGTKAQCLDHHPPPVVRARHLFSLFSLVTFFTGDEAWLGYLGFLGFLGFLAPANPPRMPESAR